MICGILVGLKPEEKGRAILQTELEQRPCKTDSPFTYLHEQVCIYLF
ncbi:hypothetical protein NMG60_11006938 [Bertholletia excelsa]